VDGGRSSLAQTPQTTTGVTKALTARAASAGPPNQNPGEAAPTHARATGQHRRARGGLPRVVGVSSRRTGRPLRRQGYRKHRRSRQRIGQPRSKPYRATGRRET
jgi:hypothetical protein